MRGWLIGGLFGGLLGLWFYFAKILTNYYNTKLWMTMNPTVNSPYLMYTLPDLGTSFLLFVILVIFGCVFGQLILYPIEKIRIWYFKRKWIMARGF